MVAKIPLLAVRPMTPPLWLTAIFRDAAARRSMGRLCSVLEIPRNSQPSGTDDPLDVSRSISTSIISRSAGASLPQRCSAHLPHSVNLGLPSIGGKDTMSGSFEDLDVPPTLISFAVTMTKASKTISAQFKERRQLVRAAADSGGQGTERPELGKLSEGILKNVLPKWRKSVLSARRQRWPARLLPLRRWRSATSSASTSPRLPISQSLFAPEGWRTRLGSSGRCGRNWHQEYIRRCCARHRLHLRYGKIELNGKALDLDDLIETLKTFKLNCR